jgi:hypothetical protein
MPDFLSESRIKALPPTPKGQSSDGDKWLYEVFRCGFVHNFYPGIEGAWSRRPNLKEYWFPAQSQSGVALNIDELVRGFERGVEEFRRRVKADPDLRANFQKYLLA